MAVALRERRRKGGRWLGEEGALCDLYLRQGFGIIKLSRGGRQRRERREDGHGLPGELVL